MTQYYGGYYRKGDLSFKEDPYSYFMDKNEFSTIGQIQRTSEEIKEIKTNVLEELIFNLETLQVKRKKAYFKWLVMTKSKSSLRVLERVLTSSKPTVMKTLWMLRAEWMRRGSYIFQKVSLKFLDVVEPMRQRRLHWAMKAIRDRMQLRMRMGNALSALAKASKVKYTTAFEKLLFYKRNWETIQKMRLLALLRENLGTKKKLALKELFAQTRMFRPFSLVLKLHEFVTRKNFESKLALFRKFKRGDMRMEFGRHMFDILDKRVKKQKRTAFGRIDLKYFPPDFFPKGNLVNVLCNLESARKKQNLEDLQHGSSWRDLTSQSLDHLKDSHNNLEVKLAFDKIWMISICRLIYEKLKRMGKGRNLEGLKKFFGKIKMTQTMKLVFIGNGLKNLMKLVKAKKKKVFDEIWNFGDYQEMLQNRLSQGSLKLQKLMANIAKREKIKTFYQLKTGAVVSSKRSFIGKHLIAVLYALFRKRKFRAMRQMELFGLNSKNKQNKQHYDATSRIVLGLRSGNLLHKANALRRLREVILYRKNIFKNGRRYNVYNKLYRGGGPEMDESETKLAWLLKRLWLNRLDQGYMGIAAFSRFHLYKTMRGFRKEDQLNREQQNMLKLSKVIANIIFKRRLREGNHLMVRMKDSSFMMRRVYRDKVKDDHEEVVQNTIIVANLVKNFRNKQLSLMFEYFERWKESTWEYDYESDEFEDEAYVEASPNPLYGSTDITKSSFARGFQREQSMHLRRDPNNPFG